jgi:hypothetical protein
MATTNCSDESGTLRLEFIGLIWWHSVDIRSSSDQQTATLQTTTTRCCDECSSTEWLTSWGGLRDPPSDCCDINIALQQNLADLRVVECTCSDKGIAKTANFRFQHSLYISTVHD